MLSIMYSGGLDSFIAYHYATSKGYDPISCIFVDMGHPYATKEWNAIQRIPLDWRPEVDKIVMRDLHSLIAKRLSNQIIPSRNVMLAVIGAMFSPRVWINALDGEQNGKEHDKSERFFSDTSALLTFTNAFFQRETVVESPFAAMTKAETIGWALNYGIPVDVLYTTTTCYDDHEQKCGRCLTCYKRKTAFLLNGLDEPGYSVDPLTQAYAMECAEQIPIAAAANDHSRFTKKRIEEHFRLMEIIGK